MQWFNFSVLKRTSFALKSLNVVKIVLLTLSACFSLPVKIFRVITLYTLTFVVLVKMLGTVTGVVLFVQEFSLFASNTF